MELTFGRDMSAAGTIPADWSMRSLGDLCVLITKGTTPTSIGKTFTTGGVRFFKAESITESGQPVDDKIAFIDDQTHRLLKRSQLAAGDILLSIAGVLGRVGVVGSSYLPANTNQALSIIRLVNAPSPQFIFFALRGPVVQSQIHNIAVQAAQANISLQNVRDFLIPIPSDEEEQRAIAEALSDVDALLGGLDRLIAKKRDVKQAAMQQLLTGQTRLPGFHGEWADDSLGGLAEIVSGGTPKTSEPSYWNGGVKWCTPTDITGCSGKYLSSTARTISHLGLHSSGARLLPAGALLLCSRATIGEIKIATEEVCTNQGFKALICRPTVSNEFLYYKLLTMKQQMVERAFGSTFLEISKANVAALDVSIPLLPEQTAIAAVLSDMDAELSALEARRDKTRALKQAMMQELLTGRTRLV